MQGVHKNCFPFIVIANINFGNTNFDHKLDIIIIIAKISVISLGVANFEIVNFIHLMRQTPPY